LTGYSKEAVVGKHFTNLPLLQVGIKDFPKYLKFFGLVALGKDQPPLEFEYTHRDGTKKWGSANFKLVRSGRKKNEVIGILRDITEKKQAEEKINNLLKELEASNLELERTNRDLDDFTYAVAHDLKTPLRTIESFSSFLLEDHAEKLNEEGKEYLNRMSGASTRMQMLIDDLLNLSRIGRMYTEMELVDLDKLLGDVLQDLESQIKKYKAEVIVNKLPSIRTQGIWVNQLFSNLISNGLKFNKSPIPKVWVDYENQRDCHLFSVKDNGIGIEKEHEEKLFKIFQRLHSNDEYPGTGAGLTICKKIVENLGGRIWVESKPGTGSTFYFTIPKRKMDETVDPEYPHEVDQGIIQVQDELANHVE
jgi:two-component system CheB/CheR fusion protein